MLIVCPACASEYEIETDRVGPEGRAVRCAACRETWFVSPEAPADGEPDDGETAAQAAADGIAPESLVPHGSLPPGSLPLGSLPPGSMGEEPPTIIDQPSPPPRRAAPRAKRQARAARATRGSSWKRALKLSPALAAGLVLFVPLPLALLGRATVVRAMPRSAGLFAMVGLPVNLRGVEIRDVVAFRNPAEGGKPAQLVVEGDLVGVARGRVEVAPLEIEIRDAAERPVFRWSVPAPRAALEPAETARFRASLPSPPLQGSRVEVRFADAKGSEKASETKPMETKLTESKPKEAAGHADGAHAPAEAAHPAPSAGHAGH